MRLFPKRNKVRKHKIWKVWGNELPVILVVAENMDEACRLARKIDEGYDTFQIWDKKVDKKF